MKIAILASTDSWYMNDLGRAGNERGHKVMPVRFTTLSSYTSTGTDSVLGQTPAGSVELGEYDAVIVRTMPHGSLEQVVFRMDALNLLESRGVAVINPGKAIEACVDKYLCLSLLQRASLPVPKTCCCQTYQDAMLAFEQLGNDVVVKPVFGGEGRGVVRVDCLEIADRVFRALEQVRSIIYLQQFVDHAGFDIRYLVIGEQVLAMRRVNHADWRTNASRGARCEPYTPDGDEVQMARRAANAAGCLIAGVDIIESKNGDRYVLEVNAVPGWKALNKALSMDTAQAVVKYVEIAATKGIASTT